MNSWRELLITAAAALVLWTLTVAANGGQKAADLRCQASLKEIYRMAAGYSAENDGFIVRCIERKKVGVVFWPERFRDNARDFRDFSCPANPKRGAKAFVEDDLLPARFSLAQVSFGINVHISNHFEKIERVKNPAYVVYFGDSNTLRLRAVGKLWAQDWTPVHDNGIQSVMTDGHVEYFTHETLGTYGKVPGWKQDQERWKNWKN